MAGLFIVTRTGKERYVTGEIGISVMEIIRNAGIGEMLALCGGCQSCATCHVFVDGNYINLLGKTGDIENDLLDACAHRSELSRLSCQLLFSAALDGMRVTIAPEE